MAVGLQTHIWNNNLKSILLLMGYPFLLIFLLWLFFTIDAATGGQTELNPVMSGFDGVAQHWHVMLVIAGVWFMIAWMFHQNMINAATGAKPLDRTENPRVYNLLENLCISRGIKTPKLFIIESPALNAYASGISEKSYAVTVTRGIMQALDDAELEAVLAHELSHIRNRDVRLLIVGVIFVGMISFFAEMTWRGMVRRSGGKKDGRAVLIAGLVLAVGYALALLIRFAISRKREFMADAGAVELTKNPDAMANALRKISGHAEMENIPAEVQQMFIENSADFFSVFATHPPIEERIRVLEEYAGATRPLPGAAIPAVPTPATAPAQTPSAGPWG